MEGKTDGRKEAKHRKTECRTEGEKGGRPKKEGTNAPFFRANFLSAGGRRGALRWNALPVPLPTPSTTCSRQSSNTTSARGPLFQPAKVFSQNG